MKLSSKAAVYSAFVFPGAGFFLVKRRELGIVFAIITLLAFFGALNFAMQVAQGIADQIIAGRISPDPTIIMSEVRKALATADNFIYNFSKAVLIVTWLVSIPLSFWMGTMIEKNPEAPNSNNL